MHNNQSIAHPPLTLLFGIRKAGNVVGRTQCRIENAQHPDNQSDDARLVEMHLVLLVSDNAQKARIAFDVRVICHCRPGQKDRVQRNHRALEQTGLGRELLHLWPDRYNAYGQTEDHIECDEEFIQRAIVGLGEVHVEQCDTGQREYVL